MFAFSSCMLWSLVYSCRKKRVYGLFFCVNATLEYLPLHLIYVQYFGPWSTRFSHTSDKKSKSEPGFMSTLSLFAWLHSFVFFSVCGLGYKQHQIKLWKSKERIIQRKHRTSLANVNKQLKEHAQYRKQDTNVTEKQNEIYQICMQVATKQVYKKGQEKYWGILNHPVRISTKFSVEE